MTPPTLKRAHDFRFSGVYEVAAKTGKRRIFRDPESTAWLDADRKAPTHSPLPFVFLGWTKAEALNAIAS
jgi:hypothetical protein